MQEEQPLLFQELQGAKTSVSEGCQQVHSQNSAKIVVVQSVLVVYKSNDKVFNWKEDLCRFLKDITFAIQFPQNIPKRGLMWTLCHNSTPQVATVLVAMAPKILELAT